jgi:hypothetical protein
MKWSILIFYLLFRMNEKSGAQAPVTGEYYLRGVTEVGSGFLLKPDSTFSFFFSTALWTGEAPEHGN